MNLEQIEPIKLLTHLLPVTTLYLGIIIGKNERNIKNYKKYLSEQIRIHKTRLIIRLNHKKYIKHEKNSLLSQNRHQNITLTTGTYEIGKDIKPGVYNLDVISGKGLITGNLQNKRLSETMGISEGKYYANRYEYLDIKTGDILSIYGNVRIEFSLIS